MNFDFNSIYDFCKVRNLGTASRNGNQEYTPRVKFLIDLIEKYNIPYEVDTYPYDKNTNLHNIYLKGTSDKWVMAHHDVCNHRVDNANDNSASVINAIALKTIRPDINVALVDGEEAPIFGGGSTRFSELTKKGDLNVSWVLNLELSGYGGENFFIGNYNTPLTKSIKDKFNCAVMNVPFNDAAILINNGNINAALINPCPLLPSYKILSMSESTKEYLNEASSKKIKYFQGIIDRLSDRLSKGDGDQKELAEDIIEYNELLNDEKSKGEYSIGSILSKSDFSRLPRDIQKGITYEELTPDIKGRMPEISEMDISILHRCHTTDDTVDHIVTSDMRDFVTRVLTVICEL